MELLQMTTRESVVPAAGVTTDRAPFEFLFQSQHLRPVIRCDLVGVLAVPHHLAASDHDALAVGDVGVLAIDETSEFLQKELLALTE